MERIKVLYIAGYGRSGTTILDNVLGKVDGWFTVGELRYVWDRGIAKNWSCGCGVPFESCDFWNTVLYDAFQGAENVDHEMMIRQRDPWLLRAKNLQSVIVNGRVGKKSDEPHRFQDALGRLYHSIGKVTSSDVIVDSSKWPTYGRILASHPLLDLYVIHLVRDPRAVAFSWKRTRKYEPFERSQIYIPKHNSIRTSCEWVVWNLAIEHYLIRTDTHFLFLRYEDFVKSPLVCLTQIMTFVGELESKVPHLYDGGVELKENHCVSGNPSRFLRGHVKLKKDDEWTKKLSSLEKRIVSALTWPLLRRYGYS